MQRHKNKKCWRRLLLKNLLSQIMKFRFLSKDVLRAALVFKIPGVAEAVIQKPSSLISSLSWASFSSQSSKHHYTQTVRARELKLLENVPP